MERREREKKENDGGRKEKGIVRDTAGVTRLTSQDMHTHVTNEGERKNKRE